MLFELVRRVPEISNSDIAVMRHIEPVLRQGYMFRRIAGISSIDPRDSSFLWDAKPTGEPFTFSILNMTVIITQHHSAVFFKPSLAEIYAWIRVYMPMTWQQVRFFCIEDNNRIDGTTDVYCKCTVMGGDMLVEGKPVRFISGAIGHELVVSGR